VSQQSNLSVDQIAVTGMLSPTTAGDFDLTPPAGGSTSGSIVFTTDFTVSQPTHYELSVMYNQVSAFDYFNSNDQQEADFRLSQGSIPLADGENVQNQSIPNVNGPWYSTGIFQPGVTYTFLMEGNFNQSYPDEYASGYTADLRLVPLPSAGATAGSSLVILLAARAVRRRGAL